MNTSRTVETVFFSIIAVLSLAGIIVSAVSLQRHYSKSPTEFCDFTQQFNCDIVNRSQWSELAGIPVAAIGVAGYIFLFVLSTFRRSRPETVRLLFGAAFAGTLFAFYLTYVEAYQLMTWCILCITSQIIILLITLLAAVVMLKSRTPPATPPAVS